MKSNIDTNGKVYILDGGKMYAAKSVKGKYQKVGTHPIYHNGVSIKSLPLPGFSGKDDVDVPVNNMPRLVDKTERKALLQELSEILESCLKDDVKPYSVDFNGCTAFVYRYGLSVVITNQSGVILDGCTSSQTLHGTEALRKVFNPNHVKRTVSRDDTYVRFAETDLGLIELLCKVYEINLKSPAEFTERETALGTMLIVKVVDYVVMVNRAGVIIDAIRSDGTILYGVPAMLDEQKSYTIRVTTGSGRNEHTVVARTTIK